MVDWKRDGISPGWVIALLSITPLGVVAFFAAQNPKLIAILLCFPCSSILFGAFTLMLAKITRWSKVTRSTAITLAMINVAIVVAYGFIWKAMNDST